MQFKKKILKNGMRIITVPMKDNPTVTVLVLVETGSKYETKKLNGISHFLEHMCFKGTVKRPTAMAISRELDSLGCQYNAFTSQEYTGYYAKSEKKHFKKILDVVSDIYLHSTFPEAEMEKEKGVIIEEINMYEDMPQSHVQELFLSLLYGDQPAGWSIAGPRENIRKMKRDDFVEYKKMHYVAKATTVVVSGAITEKEAVKEVEKYFAPIRVSSKGGKLRVKDTQSNPQVFVQYKKTDQAHFVLGVRAYDILNKKNPILNVLSTILAGGMSSRLFQKLREEMGVAYYVRSMNDAYTDHGFLEISAGVDVKRVPEVVKEILAECTRLIKEPVLEDELKKVKDYMIGNLHLELESSDSLANFTGGQEILKKKIETPLEIAKKIRSVTAPEIMRLAKEIFTNRYLNFALIGPFKDQKAFKSILSFSNK
ncbi:MAG: pitrilysin family protein [Candidatus Paceibacterota bacterium]|jgi:predicted Zn-dependent peptidase